jgi:hypothetical protein
MSTKKAPGIYHFPPFTRGDTFRARVIATLKQGEDSLGLNSAFLQIRHKKTGALLHEWTTTGGSPNATITGADSNSVTLGSVNKSITADWVPGDYEYELEVEFSSDDANLTILAGNFPVEADLPRDA